MRKSFLKINTALISMLVFGLFTSNYVIKAKGAPILNASDIKIEINKPFNPLEGVSADDEEDGNITSKIKINGDVNTKKIGKYKVKYSVSDSKGNVVVKEITVQVVKNNPGSIKEGKSKENNAANINTENNIPKEEKDRLNEDKKSMNGGEGELFNPFEGIDASSDQEKINENKIEVNNSQLGMVEKVQNEIDNGDNKLLEKEPIIEMKNNYIQIGKTFDPLKEIVAKDYLGNDISKNVEISGSVDTKKAGEYILNYSVADGGGNNASKNIKVTVLDGKKPTINAKNKTIAINEKFDPLKGVTAIDMTNGDITPRLIYSGNVDITKAGTYKVRYRVYDNDGNEGYKDVKITVSADIKSNKINNLKNKVDKKIVDNTSDTKINQSSVKSIKENILNRDTNTDPNSNEKQNTEGNGISEVNNDLQKSNNETSELDTELQSKKLLTKVGSKPVINVIDRTIKQGSDFLPLQGINAIDKEDGDISDKVTYDGTVDTVKVGDYELTYYVADSNNNSVSKKAKISVLADMKPIINASDKTLKQDDTFLPMDGVSATDMESGDITDKITCAGGVDTSRPGEYEVTYKVIDNNYNLAEKIIKVNVLENMPPIINVGDKVIKQGDVFNPMLDAEAIDPEDGDITNLLKYEGSVDTSRLGDYKLVYKVKDSNGKQDKKETNVTVLADRKPIINAGDKYQLAGVKFDPLKDINVIDLEDGDITSKLTVDNSVNDNVPGRYFVNYSVTDAGNNKVDKKILIYVIGDNANVNEDTNTQNTVPNSNLNMNMSLKNSSSNINKIDEPMINATNKIIMVGSKFNPRDGVSAVDYADGDITSKITVDGYVNANLPGIYELTYSVADNNGNITKKIVSIAVLDYEKTTQSKELINNYKLNNGYISTIESQKSSGKYYNNTYNNTNTSIGTNENLNININNNSSNTKKENNINYNENINNSTSDNVNNNTNNTSNNTNNQNQTSNSGGNGNSNQDSNTNNQNSGGDTGVGDGYPTILANDRTIEVNTKSFNPFENVSAKDSVDGDISDLVVFDGTFDLNTIGNYNITYKVTNSRNKTGTKAVVFYVVAKKAASINVFNGNTVESASTNNTIENKVIEVIKKESVKQKESIEEKVSNSEIVKNDENQIKEIDSEAKVAINKCVIETDKISQVVDSEKIKEKESLSSDLNEALVLQLGEIINKNIRSTLYEIAQEKDLKTIKCMNTSQDGIEKENVCKGYIIPIFIISLLSATTIVAKKGFKVEEKSIV